MPQETPLYQIEGLRKSFRLRQGGVLPVIRGLDLVLDAGAWYALTGRSGSGKTTLLHLLAGLDSPTGGRILFRGEDMATMGNARLTALRRSVLGYVFQSYHLFPELTALENAALPALHWGVDRGKAYLRAEARLTEFGLRDRLHHRPRELSGGEQQRVAIARSLINDPQVILADEPTGNLDSGAAEGIVRILQDLCHRQGRTIVMVTHDLGIAALADQEIELRDGTAVRKTPR